jgi:hypothetical protein
MSGCSAQPTRVVCAEHMVFVLNLDLETHCMLSINLFPIFFLLALFPVAFFWLRRVYRILFKRDYSEVALKRGVPPPDPEKYAPYEMAINLVGGTVIVAVIGIVLLGLLDYQSWIAVAGSTLWLKLFASFALSRQAHGLGPKSKPKNKNGAQGATD